MTIEEKIRKAFEEGWNAGFDRGNFSRPDFEGLRDNRADDWEFSDAKKDLTSDKE